MATLFARLVFQSVSSCVIFRYISHIMPIIRRAKSNKSTYYEI